MTTETKKKVAPNSKDSEMMVLGCMLTTAEGLKIAAQELDDSDFYFTEHKIIFQAMKTAYKNNKPADVHLICEELKRRNELNDVGGAGYITTLAQFAGTSANIEEYIELVKNKSLLRDMISIGQEAQDNALNNPDDPANYLIEKFQNNLKILEQRHGKKIPITSPFERLEKQKLFLEKHRGKDIIGLRTSKIPEFNTHLLGLRELILLAAAPNVGKTAITIQLGLDVLENEKEACLIYVSLEMSSLAIFNRMTLHLASMDFNTFVLGSQKIQEAYGEVFFTIEELKKIERAKEKLLSFGERLQIIESETCPFIDTKMIINYVEAVKIKTKCKRAIVIIDYLQVWPTPENKKFSSDIEVDKWRINEMKKIRDGIQNDPVIVITEARKPSGNGEEWGENLSDVMGSARGSYTPDVVCFMNQLQPKDLKKLWEKMQMPSIPNLNDDSEDIKDGSNIKTFLANHGIAICKFKVDKARDGMQKFNALFAFHFRKNKFEKLDQQMILGLVMENKNKAQSMYNDNQHLSPKEYDDNGNEIIRKFGSK